MTEKDYLTALSAFLGFGPVRLKLLLNYFGSAKKVWNVSDAILSKVGISKSLVANFLSHRKNFDIKSYLSKVKDNDIKIISLSDSDYPANLKKIDDAPFILYVKGNLKKIDTKAVAIVGTRAMTSYGKEMARKFAGELANFGVTVVSGLALGIDAEAQKAAIVNGGRTIAVLASGLDIITPSSNKSLAMEIINKNGAILSEYPLGHTPFKQDFAVRNRIISGLSRGVLVVEARKQSGTFYTVDAATKQGKPVFAVPGPLSSPASSGCNYLIQNGAPLVTNAYDILRELDLQFKVDPVVVEKVMPQDENEVRILKVIEKEEAHLDEVVRISGLKTAVVSAKLIIMEMKGMVKNLGDGMYRKI